MPVQIADNYSTHFNDKTTKYLWNQDETEIVAESTSLQALTDYAVNVLNHSVMACSDGYNLRLKFPLEGDYHIDRTLD